MLRREVMIGIGALALAGCAAPDRKVQLRPGTTLILVRHGEKREDALTKAGQDRADALSVALADVEIDAVYSTSYKRNVATAEPVATQKNLPILTLADYDVAPNLLAGNAGKTILWVGNKGNLAPIWEALSLPGPAPLNYGDLAFVRADAQGAVTVETVRFGA